MEENFLNHFKLLIQFCNANGLTYLSDNKSTTKTISKFINITIRISLIGIYFYAVYEYVTIIIKEKHLSQILRIGDIIGITAGTICVILKWLFHYIQRSQMENLILKVKCN